MLSCTVRLCWTNHTKDSPHESGVVAGNSKPRCLTVTPLLACPPQTPQDKSVGGKGEACPAVDLCNKAAEKEHFLSIRLLNSDRIRYTSQNDH